MIYQDARMSPHPDTCVARGFALISSASLNRPADKGCRGGSFARSVTNGSGIFPAQTIIWRLRSAHIAYGDEQMPKLKTKSGAKKRFKLTGTGKVVYAHRGKRHGMIKRTNKQIRNLRGTNVLFKSDGDNVKKYFLPND
jgi:large subunit ribosomal protein L35